MGEIASARGSTGLTVVSTFSGCGGSCLGFEMAGYDVRYACEFVESARETYKKNHPPTTYLDPRDIRAVKPEEILERLGLKRGELDVFEGSPPCASFSTAGNRDKDWGKVKAYSDVKQRTDDLFFEWARILDGLQPKVFVAENVSGLVKGKAFGYFKMILARLEECGYVVGARVLDAQWLGVAQTRQRLILIGVRKDVARKLGMTKAEIPYPKPRKHFYSIRDALPHLQSVVHDTSGLYGQGEVIDKPSPAITVGVNSVNSYHFRAAGPRVAEGSDAPWSEDAVHPIHSETFAEPETPFTGDPRLYVRDGRRAGEVVSIDAPAPTIMAGGLGGVQHSQMVLEVPLPRIDPTEEELVPAYKAMNAPSLHREWDRTAVGEQSDRYFNLVKAHPDRPSPAILAMHGKVNAGVCHPFERRKFTIREVKRICAFPDDFALAGTYAQQWERLGRSVPPRMMYTVAAAVRDGIFARLGALREGWSEAP
jgi:DNA (cytosine-5)-methyltransferase 1